MRTKGIEQVHQGFLYGLQFLRLPYVRSGKLVYYRGFENHGFSSEEIPVPSYYLTRSPPQILRDMYEKGKIDLR